MSDTDRMVKEIDRITLVLTGVLMLVSVIGFPHMVKTVALGIAIGALTGLLGFHMIRNMANRVVDSALEDGSSAYRSYLNRSLLYVAIFAISISQGVNVFALLAGMLAHKVSILIYTWRHRKEDD